MAEKMLNAAIHFNGLHPEANLFAGLCASRRGDIDTSVELLGRAHAVAPHNAEIVRDYGAILFRANRTKEAVPLLRRVSTWNRIKIALKECARGSSRVLVVPDI